MWTIFGGIFLVLHGLVHLLYAGQSGRYFELQPGLTWPDGAWLFARFLGVEPLRQLAVVLLGLATLVYAAGGFGLIFRQDWWRPAAIGAAAFSSLIYIMFWDGRFLQLAEKGGVGILINLAVVTAIMVWK